MKLSDIIPILEEMAPPEYALPGDRIGLQVGDPDQDVRSIVVTMDLTHRVLGEAIRRNAGLIIAHHPLIYDPLTSVRSDIYPQSLIYRLIKAGIPLYIMHTNYDAAEGGTDDTLAERLGLIDTRILEPTYTGKNFKLVTFVPVDSVDAVRDAMSDAGAGIIGSYSHCSFQSKGEGTFTPMEGSEPWVGHVGEFETADEYRLEMMVPEISLHDVISAMIKVHPYEEVAYDVYPLWNKGVQRGFGRYGKLVKPMTFDGFCEMVRDVLEVEDTRVSGDPESIIETVALMGGSGGSRIDLAHSVGADVYVTGDVKHSQFMQAQALGINMLDATHFHTERPGMIALAPRLYDALSSDGVTVEYIDDMIINGE
ncbi:MAG: Nif3-like dinuclear metal center hexameric protein [Armatimonadota bacterium]